MAYQGYLSLARVSSRIAARQSLFNKLMALDFDAVRCEQAITEMIAAGSIAPEWISLDAFRHGGAIATEAMVFGQPTTRGNLELSTKAITKSLQAEDYSDLLGFATRVASADSYDELMDSIDPVDDLTDVLRAGYGHQRPAPPWPSLVGNGIQRREHASLMFQFNQTRLILDPRALSPDWTTGEGKNPRADGTLANAVLITHSHNDHYCLPSIAAYVGEDTRVVVPHVPRPSILSDDMAAEIRSVGFGCVDPNWWHSIKVDDVRIDVLPFYGEQPTRTAARAFPDARNWGNCYRITTPEMSVLILVDSGIDPEGSMVDVVERSVAEHGPIDIVMSCCLTFQEAVNPGLPHYFLVVPFEQLGNLRDSMTLGTEGLVDVCRAARAHTFMPYAHGWAELGTAPNREVGLCDELRQRLAAAGVATRVVPWGIGDTVRWRGGPVVEPWRI